MSLAPFSRQNLMHDSDQPIADFHNVTKRFGASTALRDFSLTLEATDFVSLIGPSGCGKTTLLRLAAGLTSPSEGNIQLGAASDSLAYIFQEATLLPWRTARRNVELPMQLAGWPREKRQARADALIQLVGLADATGKYPRQLSGGMKMRVSLARGLALGPRLMLMDEPFGALDAMTRNRLNSELLSLRERHPFAALFVTHSVTEAVFLSNRIVVMAPGRIAAVIEVPFAYPRVHALREQPAFYKKVAEVTALLHKAEEAAT